MVSHARREVGCQHVRAAGGGGKGEVACPGGDVDDARPVADRHELRGVLGERARDIAGEGVIVGGDGAPRIRLMLGRTIWRRSRRVFERGRHTSQCTSGTMYNRLTAATQVLSTPRPASPR